MALEHSLSFLPPTLNDCCPSPSQFLSSLLLFPLLCPPLLPNGRSKRESTAATLLEEERVIRQQRRRESQPDDNDNDDDDGKESDDESRAKDANLRLVLRAWARRIRYTPECWVLGVVWCRTAHFRHGTACNLRALVLLEKIILWAVVRWLMQARDNFLTLDSPRPVWHPFAESA